VSLKYRMFIPIGLTLVAAIAISGWLVVRQQAAKTEAAYRERLTNLVLTSRVMIHSEAESFMKARGMTFHRVLPGQSAGTTTADKLGEEAFRIFSADPKQELFERQVEDKGVRTLYVFSPAAIKDTCHTCHGPDGLDFFSGKKEGELVAAFGASTAMTELEENKAAIVWGVVVASAVILALMSILFGFILSRSVLRPLNNVTEMLKDISQGEGDLTRLLDVRREDEFGRLGRHFNAFVGKQRDLILQIRQDTSVLAGASAELTDISRQMSSNVKEISDTASTVAASAEESSANTASVASSMEHASSNLVSVAGATEEMSATVAEIASSSEKARAISSNATSQAQSISTMMQHLGQAAQQIGRVTETITAISSQTNLLALNATIEAARAGAAGKGFAVVANEIKELAQQASAASQDIKTIISSVQSSTDDAVSETGKIRGVIIEMGSIVSNIAAAIEQQASATTDVAANLAQASNGVQEANDRVGQTAAASSMIARDIAAVNSSISEIRHGGEQVQEKAAELSSLSGRLEGLVRRFKIDAA
jgi:methyl-accepting chemotaxis protein